MRPAHPRPNGFTLLELLVAIAILALIAMASYRLLTDTVSARNQGRSHEQSLQSLQKAEMIIQRDLLQVAPRAVRDAFGDSQPAFYIPQENSMEFTRRGWRNPLQETRSNLVRVAYHVENEQLIREHWMVLDRARDSISVKTVLLDKISNFHVQVFNKGQWGSAWPLLTASQTAAQKLPLPDAVEIRFTLQPWGEIRRVFVLPENDANIDVNNNNNGGTTTGANANANPAH
jgi:general secretion pathway protein J